MTINELTQGNIDDVTLVSKHETKAMGFMMFKVSEQELLDARNAVIKRMFELREPKQSLVTDPREGKRVFLTDDMLEMLEEGLTDLFGHDRTYATPVCNAIRDLRDAAMDVCNNARESEEPDRYSVSVTLVHNLQFLLTGM